MNEQKGFTSVELIFVIIWLVGVGGWIANIVKLVDSNFDPITGIVVVRALGIVVPPLGAVMGFI